VTLVVWKDRLLLFWLRIVKKAPDAVHKPFTADDDLIKLKTGNINPNPPEVIVAAVLCWSEYYNGKWQPTKTSDVDRPYQLGQFGIAGSKAFDRSTLFLNAQTGEESVQLSVHSVPFVLYNTNSLPVVGWQGEFYPTPAGYRSVQLGRGQTNDILQVVYYHDPDGIIEFVHDLLKIPKGTSANLTLPNFTFDNAWSAPFFLADNRHVFSVTTARPLVKLFDNHGYGVVATPNSTQSAQITPLILSAGPRTDDISIRQGIGKVGSVFYGGKLIGSSGVMSTVRAET
jgi:hypothetical protein